MIVSSVIVNAFMIYYSGRRVPINCFYLWQAARRFESQLAESILEGNGQLAFEKLATATLEKLMPRIEGKGEFGQARWRVVYAPQIPSLVSVDPTADPLKSLASNISFGTEVEVQLGKRLQVIIIKLVTFSKLRFLRPILPLISVDLCQSYINRGKKYL